MDAPKKLKELRGTLRIKLHRGKRIGFTIRINERRQSAPVNAHGILKTVRGWSAYWTRSLAWNKPNYEGSKMIRVLIKKEQPFEVHVVVNPADKLDVQKLEGEGFYHIGDYDGEKQIDEAVSSVAVYLEIEEGSPA